MSSWERILQNCVVIYEPKVSRPRERLAFISFRYGSLTGGINCLPWHLTTGSERLHAISVLRGAISRAHTLRGKARKNREHNVSPTTGKTSFHRFHLDVVAEWRSLTKRSESCVRVETANSHNDRYLVRIFLTTFELG